MADEVKQEEKQCCTGKKVTSSIFKVILGLVFLAVAAYLLFARLWWADTLIKGCAGPFLVLAAVITFAIAKE